MSHIMTKQQTAEETVMDKMREEFEAWYEGHCAPLESNWFKRDSDFPDDYDYFPAQEAWSGWKASRAALCVELPDAETGFDGDSIFATGDIHDALDVAGVRYK